MPRLHYANTENADMFYMLGARVPDPFFMLEIGRERVAFLNKLEIGAFHEHNRVRTLRAKPIEPLWKEARQAAQKGSVGGKIAFVLLKRHKLLKRAIVVPSAFPLDIADHLRSRGVRLKIEEPFVPERVRKNKKEIAYIHDNLRHISAAFSLIERILRTSRIKDGKLILRGKVLTSEYIKEQVEKFLFRKGMEDIEGMIISSGAQAAMPHHKGSGPIRANATIICDIFFRNRKNRYFGDMTRTYVKGSPSKKILAMQDAVARAQDAALSKIKAGMSAKEVYGASAKAIRDAGFDVGNKGYIHGLGHGVGLELHEAPYASPNSPHILEVGNILTVEPGLYYPHIGGVRIEDVVVVTANGYKKLSAHHRDLVIS